MRQKPSFFRKLSCIMVSAVLGAALCVTASAAEGDVAINAANFPDAIFRNVVSTRFDTDHDGVLSQTEIANVTSIGWVYDDEGTEVYSYNKDELMGFDFDLVGVANFTGIQYFTELKYLYAEYSELTSLDVTQNTKLEVLDCCCTSLDVTHNPNLRELDVFGELTSLDVSQNPQLEILDCSYDQLTSLDVTHNPNLKELYCNNNQLTSLDISMNPALNWLECDRNQLTKLDVSNNTALYMICDADVVVTGAGSTVDIRRV